MKRIIKIFCCGFLFFSGMLQADTIDNFARALKSIAEGETKSLENLEKFLRSQEARSLDNDKKAYEKFKSLLPDTIPGDQEFSNLTRSEYYDLIEDEGEIKKIEKKHPKQEIKKTYLIFFPIFSDDASLTKNLLQRTKNINIKHIVEDGYVTLLGAAIFLGDLDVVKMIIDRDRKQVYEICIDIVPHFQKMTADDYAFYLYTNPYPESKKGKYKAILDYLDSAVKEKSGPQALKRFENFLKTPKIFSEIMNPNKSEEIKEDYARFKKLFPTDVSGDYEIALKNNDQELSFSAVFLPIIFEDTQFLKALLERTKNIDKKFTVKKNEKELESVTILGLVIIEGYLDIIKMIMQKNKGLKDKVCYWGYNKILKPLELAQDHLNNSGSLENLDNKKIGIMKDIVDYLKNLK